MGGRGTFASGNNVAYSYETVGKIEGVKVLKGIAGKHSYPKRLIRALHISSSNRTVLFMKCVFMIRSVILQKK